MKLKENQPIKIRNDYVVKKSHIDIIDIRDDQKRKGTTEKTERVYYLWFMFLKLLLEMGKMEWSSLKGSLQKV